MTDILLWIFYTLLIIAAFFAALNQWRLWKHPYMFKGDTGPPGVTGAQGPLGKCYCDECLPPMDNPKLRLLGGPRTKEEAYGLPPIPED